MIMSRDNTYLTYTIKSSALLSYLQAGSYVTFVGKVCFILNLRRLLLMSILQLSKVLLITTYQILKIWKIFRFLTMKVQMMNGCRLKMKLKSPRHLILLLFILKWWRKRIEKLIPKAIALKRFLLGELALLFYGGGKLRKLLNKWSY